MLYFDFNELSMPVLGLHLVINDGGVMRCGCLNPNCGSIGKHPRDMRWTDSTVRTYEELSQMEEAGDFGTGYGVLVSGGLLIIDVDARDGDGIGIESFDRLHELIPDLKSSAGLIVHTGSGSGSMHLYYKVDGPMPDLVTKHADFPSIDFKSSGYVVGPGSAHASGGKYNIFSGGHPREIGPPPPELLDILKRPKRYRVTVNNKISDITMPDVADMLAALDPDCHHDDWVSAGMAIHNLTGGADAGFDQWHDWSAMATKANKYLGEGHMRTRWLSFGSPQGDPIKIGTLITMANWSRPVTFKPTEDDPAPQMPDISGVDLLDPPGLVGEVCQWINGRSRYPRRNLAVGAALAVVSSLGGMRHREVSGETAPNVFMFCVAKSSTGKQSILNSANSLLRTGGLGGAIHGAFKSEQELFRNLFDHQGAFYFVDEMGEVLDKLTKAKKSGSAPYLTGLIGQLMSVYSASNSTVNITGDTKRELAAIYAPIYKGLKKQHEESPNDEDIKNKMLISKRRLDSSNTGLEKPYLNIFGVTSPEVFDSVMTYELLINGFVARTVILRELEDNPERNNNRIPKKIPVPMALRLQSLYSPSGGSKDGDVRCQQGQMQDVIPTPAAKKMLDDVYWYFHALAEHHKNTTGLTPIPRRGLELVAKIALILGMDEQKITTEHVIWAWALVDRDIAGKIALGVENSAAEGSEAITAKILSLVTTSEAKGLGEIVNNCRKWDKPIVIEEIGQLVNTGALREEPSPSGRSKVYYLA